MEPEQNGGSKMYPAHYEHSVERWEREAREARERSRERHDARPHLLPRTFAGWLEAFLLLVLLAAFCGGVYVVGIWLGVWPDNAG